MKVILIYLINYFKLTMCNILILIINIIIFYNIKFFILYILMNYSNKLIKPKQQIKYNNTIYQLCGKLINTYYNKAYFLYEEILSSNLEINKYYELEGLIQMYKDNYKNMDIQYYKYIIIPYDNFNINFNNLFTFGPREKIIDNETINIIRGPIIIGPYLAKPDKKL
jgi:hypothetical protein